MEKENEEEFMLTTFDNPINPFENFNAWWKLDILLGHDCCGYLAREAPTSEVFSDELNNEIIKEAVDRICEREKLIYRKVTRKDYANVS